MLLRLKSPLSSLLSSYQGGGRKGHTTITQATALWSNVLQLDGEAYVVLLDIAKAYPNTPHPLLWETMYRVGPSLCWSKLRCVFCRYVWILIFFFDILTIHNTCTTGAQHRTLKERPILSGYRWQF